MSLSNVNNTVVKTQKAFITLGEKSELIKPTDIWKVDNGLSMAEINRQSKYSCAHGERGCTQRTHGKHANYGTRLGTRNMAELLLAFYALILIKPTSP